MHTFLLGMVCDESAHHVAENSGCMDCTVFYRRLNSMCVPYDIGRLPTNFGCKTSFSDFTAQQWKIMLLCMQKHAYVWGLLPGSAYKSMCLLCDIVSLIPNQY